MVERIFLALFKKFNSLYVPFLAWILRPFVLVLGKGLFNGLYMVGVSFSSVIFCAGSGELGRMYGSIVPLIGITYTVLGFVNMFYVWAALDRIKES